MNKQIHFINKINNNFTMNNTKNLINHYIVQYKLNNIYKNYIKNDSFNLDNELKDNLDDWDDWTDCDDIKAYTEAYNTVMEIKNNLSCENIFTKYFRKNNKNNNNNNKKENKFIKEQAKTKYEYLFFKYYDELLSIEL